MSANKQTAINIVSSVAVFALNLCVSFFLTPFIVKQLGTAAYGFVGLSANIISYTSLLTVAVNSMGGRFITIKVHEGDMLQADSFISSIFYANVALSGLIMLLLGAFTVWMPDIIKVPADLLADVRTLFILLGVNSCLGLVTGVISVAAFIRNRLDIVNIRSLVGTVIRVVLLLALFGLFPPRLWYLGISALVMGVYVIVTNYYFYRKLTPDLHIGRKYFDFKRLREVVATGVWTIVTRLSEILSRGFDLLLANLFISARAMGLLSITQTIPVMINSFFATICANFNPEQTRLYAIKDFAGLKNELLKALRMCGLLSSIPLSIVFAFGDIFYKLWLPTEDAGLLYRLTVVGSLGMVFAMPLEPLWNIFTITNKIRRSSLNLLYNSIGIFATILLSMFVFSEEITRLFVLAGTRSLFGIGRCIFFLPLYGAKCLGLPRSTFYPPIVKNVFNIMLCVGVSLIFKHLYQDVSWGYLTVASLFTCVVAFGISCVTILKPTDRIFILQFLKSKLTCFSLKK